MKKLQMILKAKTYIEFMAHSIDPTTQESIDDSVLQKREIKDMLLYTVSLLDELIVNDGEVINVASPIEFSIDKINKNLIAVSDQPVQIGGFVKRINNQVDKTKMKTFKTSRLTEWLLSNGYLNKGKKPVVRNQTVYCITSSSKDIGIVEQDNINLDTGEMDKTIVLTKMAQEFIVENLESIMGLSEDDVRLPDHSVQHPALEMAGQKWTKDEQQRLIHEFIEEKLTITHIAELHHRKPGGIRSRLVKLGLIEK